MFYSIKFVHKLDGVDHISASIPSLLQLTPVMQVIPGTLFLFDINADNVSESSRCKNTLFL